MWFTLLRLNWHRRTKGSFPIILIPKFPVKLRWQRHLKPFCEFWCSFSFHTFYPTTRNRESHLAEQLRFVQPMIGEQLNCCTLPIPLACQSHRRFILSSNCRNKHKSHKKLINSLYTLSSTLISLQYTADHQLNQFWILNNLGWILKKCLMLTNLHL